MSGYKVNFNSNYSENIDIYYDHDDDDDADDFSIAGKWTLNNNHRFYADIYIRQHTNKWALAWLAAIYHLQPHKNRSRVIVIIHMMFWLLVCYGSYLPVSTRQQYYIYNRARTVSNHKACS